MRAFRNTATQDIEILVENAGGGCTHLQLFPGFPVQASSKIHSPILAKPGDQSPRFSIQSVQKTAACKENAVFIFSFPPRHPPVLMAGSVHIKHPLLLNDPSIAYDDCQNGCTECH